MSEENKNLNEEAVQAEAEEIKETAQEEIKLESPLVVHKKGDASYKEDTSAFEMNQTHTEEEDKPTLQRHRFKKEEKSKAPAVLTVLIIIVVIAGIFAGLYYTNHLPFLKREEPTSVTQSTTETTTSLQEKYAGTIVVKDIYIFVDGEQVDGLEGLQNELKYVDKSPTAYTIIDEHANSDFLNFNVLTLLEDLGFYDEHTEITHVESTGLIAYEETTTLPPETTTKKKSKKSKKSKKKSKSKETTTKKDKGN